MNPIIILGGLGILGFALMGMKKGPTYLREPNPMEPLPIDEPRPFTPGDPGDPDDPWRVEFIPGFQIPGRVA
jgi:hypothetical protein